MTGEQRRLVERVAQAQKDGRATWIPTCSEHLVLPGVTFIPTDYERQREESRHTLGSRAAGLFLFGAISMLFGACTTLDERNKAIPWGLLAGGLVTLAIAISIGRSMARRERAQRTGTIARKGIYLFEQGALVLTGERLDDEITKFFARDRIDGTTYQQSGRTSRTHLVTRDEDGREQLLVVHDSDVRPLIDAWRRGVRQ